MDTLSESEALARLGRPKRTEVGQLLRDMAQHKRKLDRDRANFMAMIPAMIAQSGSSLARKGESDVITRGLSGQAAADRTPFEWLPPGKGDHGASGYGVYNRNGDLLQVVKTPAEASRICRAAQGGRY
jgi:hypothetical protein